MNAYRVSPQSLLLIPRSLVNYAYRKFIKGQCCCACGNNWNVDPAHTGPRGRNQKATDLDIIPLCRICHKIYHEIGRLAFENRFSLNIVAIIKALQVRAQACGMDLTLDDSPKRKHLDRAADRKSRAVGRCG